MVAACVQGYSVLMSERVAALGCGYNVSFRWRDAAKSFLLWLWFCVPTTDYRCCIWHVGGARVDSNLWAAHEILISHLCVCVCVHAWECVDAWVLSGRGSLAVDGEHPQRPLAASVWTARCSRCRGWRSGGVCMGPTRLSWFVTGMVIYTSAGLDWRINLPNRFTCLSASFCQNELIKQAYNASAH